MNARRFPSGRRGLLFASFGAAALILAGGGAAAALSVSSAPAPLRSDKAEIVAAQQAAIAAARATAAPKPSSTTAPKAQAAISQAPETGITLGHDAPFPPSQFLASGSWTTEVNGQYYTVFAGVDNHDATGVAQTAGVVVYSDPTDVNSGSAPKLVGTYDDAAAAGSFTPVSSSGGVLTLTDTSGAKYTFAVPSYTYGN